MAKKPKQMYTCPHCGYQSPKWFGKCPDCGEFIEPVEETLSPRKKATVAVAPGSTPLPLSQIPTGEKERRLPTGIAELDRVLGGGIFPASVVLLAGEPGIGKSTLMLQMLLELEARKQKTLYISAEESLQQIRHRADRLRVAAAGEVLVLAETELPAIEYHLEQVRPAVVVVDSVQAIYNPEFSGAPGNVGQVRECAARLFQMAKQQGFSLFLVGHVTKEGAVAGPKILEHLVDVVLYFDANTEQHRILRSMKNRFGAAQEIGVFEMSATGLKEVTDVSGLFLTPHQRPKVGSSIVCAYEGSRPLLVEVQALVSRSGYGTPQRTVSGFDYRRLALILAILEKYSRQDFGIYDVFVKIAGGLRVNDPAIDLGVAAALYSSRQNQPLDADAVYIGELGLGGEVRPVSFVEKRLQEAHKMGFKQAYLPVQNLPDPSERKKIKMLLSPVKEVGELLLPVSRG